MILSLYENMKKIILINITLLTFLVYIFSAYNHRKFIVNNQLPIKDFSVLAVNCSSGFRGGSTIQIVYDKKSYYVGISTKQCKLLDFNDISLYYDKENDEIFEKKELSIRYIVFYSILYLVSCIWLFIAIKNKQSK